MPNVLEDVYTDDVTTTPQNGNGNPPETATDTLFEAGSPGQEDARLAELGLESVAQLSTIDEAAGESAPGLNEVTSEEAATEGGLPEGVALESLPDAYFASFDEPRPATEAHEVVIGRDDRIRINNTTAYPWRVSCSLLIETRTGKFYIGTGWFISARTVMTAGHCVYMHNEGGWAKSVTVMAGRNGNSRPFGAVKATHLRSVTGWTRNRQRDNDYGCIILPENQRVGATTGYIGFAYMDDAAMQQKYLNIAGYPGDKPSGTLWYHSQRVKSLTARTIVYDIDTAGGVSGAAVYYIHNGHRYAIGIHTNGHLRGNSATRITKAVYGLMKRWKAMGN